MSLLFRAGIAGSALAASLLAATALAAPRDFAAPLVRYTSNGMIITPRASLESAAMIGREMHTNTRIFVPGSRIRPGDTAPSGKYETPASLACVYGVTAMVSGCNPETLGTVSTRGSQVVAIVDAYDYPHAMSDLNTYSSEYGLPQVSSSTFQVMYGAGTKPGVDSTGGWELEEALDIEMVHAMAPNAKIILVEASSNSTTALLQGEVVAGQAVAAAGGGEVSNSWGGGESAGESSNAADFGSANVVYFASTGDSSGTEFPSVLSQVVAVGGTEIIRAAKGAWKGKQESWDDTGGGISTYIARPAYQSVVSTVVGSKRGVPDVSADADPDSGAWVYDTNVYEGRTLDWAVIGGTSEASPLWAGITNAAGHFSASSTDELGTIYSELGTSAFYDVKTGPCGNTASGKAGAGYDLCTGVGTPTGLAGE